MGDVIAFRSTPAIRVDRSLAAFARTWCEQAAIAWRPSTRARVDTLLRCHVLPEFERHAVEGFDRAALMRFRTQLAHARHSPSRINTIVQVVSQCLTERERQLSVTNPCRELPRLKTRRPAIQPFSLPELRRLVAAAPDYLQDYLWIRGLLGLRSGEANGLRWDCVDLVAGTIDIRRARANGVEGLPKNEYSERVIAMSPTVADAMRRQLARTGSTDGYVFLTSRGCPLDIQNFARRDWRRVLAKAGLAHRIPEQLRHTAATLMLAAGEAPTYVAQVLGHADCRMLLTIYARFVAGVLGRQDGHALENVLNRSP